MTADEAPLTKGQRTRLAILDAARAEFAGAGYERATIRAIARSAGVDPGLVMQYFGSKDNLFTQAAQVDLELSGILDGPREQLAERVLRQFFAHWEQDCGMEPMMAMLRSSMTNEAAGAELRKVLTLKVGGPLAEMIGGQDAEVRAGLALSFVMGMALTRYMVGCGQMQDAEVETMIRNAAPALQALLTPAPAEPGPAEPATADLRRHACAEQAVGAIV